MKAKIRDRDEMRAEYDFDYSKAVRGKYYERLVREGSNVRLLDPDVAKVFRDSKAVNEVLRAVLGLMKTVEQSTKRRAVSKSRAKRR